MGKLIQSMTKNNTANSLNAHFDKENSDDYLKDEIKKLIQKEDYQTLFNLKCRCTVLRSLSFQQMLKGISYMSASDIYDYARIKSLDKDQTIQLSKIIISKHDAFYIYQFMHLRNMPLDILLNGLIETENLKYLRLLLQSDVLPSEKFPIVVNEIQRIESKINARHAIN